MKFLVFFFSLGSLTSISQVKKIELMFPDDDKSHYGLEYWKFATPSDTSLIRWERFTGGYKSGLRSDYQFQIESSAPNGFYEIYVNGLLKVSGEMTNGRRNGIWTEYKHDDKTVFKWREIFWLNGMKQGKQTLYYKNGTIFYQNDFINDKVDGIAFQYNEDGTIRSREYYEKGAFLKRELLNKQGEVIDVTYPSKAD